MVSYEMSSLSSMLTGSFRTFGQTSWTTVLLDMLVGFNKTDQRVPASTYQVCWYAESHEVSAGSHTELVLVAITQGTSCSGGTAESRCLQLGGAMLPSPC